MTDIRPTLLINNNNFRNKVKRIVRTLLETSTDFRRAPENFGINGISQVINPANPIFLRFAWGFVLFGCIIVCIFQVQNRLSHYLARPVVIDVKIEEEQNFKFPSVTISSTDTAGAARLLQEHNMTVDQSTCSVPMKILLHSAKGFDANKLWSALNITPSIALAAIITRNQQYEINWKEEFGEFGTQIRFEPDKFLPYEGMESKNTVKVTKQIQSCNGSAILFSFLNRTSQICTDDTSYLQCKRRCEAKHFRNLPCRFPFIPEEVNMPMCVSSPGVGGLFGQTLMTFRTLYCHCPRHCQETVIQISKRYVQENKHYSMLSIYLVTNHAAIITERFAYDTITFLGDIGGTLGLCLGLSLLSIFDVLHKLASYVIKGSKKREMAQLFHEYPFLGLIKRLLSEELYRYRSCKQSLNINTVASQIWQMLLAIIIISCVLGSCLFIFARISKFWCEPTHMTVEIINKETVHFPNITICGLSRQIAIRLRDLEKQIEKIRHTSFKPGLNHWCTLKLTDLLDDPTMSAEKVWEESTIFTELANSIDLGKVCPESLKQG